MSEATEGKEYGVLLSGNGLEIDASQAEWPASLG